MLSTHDPIICYMPTIQHDELLYSLLARVVVCNAMGDPRSYLEKLFGSRNVVPGIDLPTRLNELHNRLGTCSPFDTVAELIDRSTLYPYHRPFLTMERHSAVQNIILSGDGKRLKTLLGRVANRFGANPPLRYCPVCVTHSIECGGVPYWHRAHQLPGVSHCIEHEMLLNTFVTSSSLSHKQTLQLPPCRSDLPICDFVPDEHQIRFALLSQSLLEMQLPSLHPTARTGIYETAISAQGLVNKKNRIDHKAVAEALLLHYNGFRSFVHRDRLLSSSAQPLGWVRALLDRPLRSMHPICHLLLIGFLFKTVAEFAKAIENYALDRKNNDHLENDIPIPLAGSRNQAMRSLLTNTALSCRSVAKLMNLSVTTVVSRRRSLGVVIQERRKNLTSTRINSIVLALEAGTTPQKIAAQLHVSLSAVYRLLAESSELNQRYNFERRRLELAARRQHWLQSIAAYNTFSLRELRTIDAATYAWLWRHDSLWLQSTNATLPKTTIRSKRVDWAARDAVLCHRLQKFVNKIEKLVDRPRISKSFMLRELGEAMVSKNIDRMPGLKQLISQTTETCLAFQYFRIDRAIIELSSLGISLSLWRIQRRAGIKNFNQVLRNYVEKKIATFS